MPSVIRHPHHEVATGHNLHQWQAVSDLPAGQVPEEFVPWLEDHGSLTERLIALSDNRFKLVVLDQRRQLPHESESAALGLASDECALVRQVCLYGRGEPWVYARSTIPEPTLASRADLGDRLGNQPLGHWIFNAPDLNRYPLQATRLKPGTSWLPAQLQRDRELWARRSIFALGEHPLLICEVFLPDFPAYRQVKTNE